MEDIRPRKRPTSSIDGFVVPENKPTRPLDKPKAERTTPIAKMATTGSLLNTTLPGKMYPSAQPTMTNAKEALKPKKKKRSKKKVVILSVLAVILLAIGVGAWDVWQLYHKLHKLNVGNLTASVGGAENILVAGSTNRCNLSMQNAQWGFCSQGVTGVNSDIIFIVHLVPATHSVSLLSIPRDTFIPNARSGAQAFKIDAALYQGPSQLVAAVQQDFGIPIQHYVEVGFDGFVNIVNAVGGMKMDFPLPVFDSESYLYVTQPGCHELNGVQALQVVRARHLQYKDSTVSTNDQYYWPQESESDTARITRTHEFLRVLASTVLAKGVTNPITDQKLIDAVAPQVQVDSGFSTSTMLALLQDFHSVNINNVPQYTLPVANAGIGSYTYQGYNMGDVVFPVEQTDNQIISKFLGAGANVNTMTGSMLPAAQSIAVNVINGSGKADQALTISDGLQKDGFNIVSQPTSATPVSTQVQETLVYYANSATEGDAIAVASKLTGYVILAQNPNNVTPNSEVTVYTGTSTGLVAAPAPAPTTATTSGTTSAPSTPAKASTPTTPSNVGSVSSSNEALAAWDPRACTTNQPIIPNNSNL